MRVKEMRESFSSSRTTSRRREKDRSSLSLSLSLSLSRPQNSSSTPTHSQKKTQNTFHLHSQRAPAPALATPLLVEAKQGGGKLKTKKAASKRIKVTATGKVLVRKAGKQHINEKMSSAKLNEKSKMARVPDRELPNVIKCLPYAGISK